MGGIITNPVSTLHIGNRAFFDAAGHRAWMNVGTYYNYGATDNMYVGLKESEERPSVGLDNLDAIIDWGDNDVSVPLTSLEPTDMYEGDHLRILFTANKAGVHPAQTDRGLELMRFIPDGYVGIGNAFNANMEPVRRLEILEDDLTPLDQPQLRLTHTKVNNGFNTGRFVDFQATSLGDLAIFPFDNTNPRRVGIGVATPTNTVDIDGDLRIR